MPLLPRGHGLCATALAPSRHIPHPSTCLCTRTHSQTHILSGCRLGPVSGGRRRRPRATGKPPPREGGLGEESKEMISKNLTVILSAWGLLFYTPPSGSFIGLVKSSDSVTSAS